MKNDSQKAQNFHCQWLWACYRKRNEVRRLWFAWDKSTTSQMRGREAALCRHGHLHRSTSPAACTEGLHSGQVYILGLAADGSSQLNAQAAEGSMLRALADSASHIPDVLGGGFLNADYWFHWSSQSTSIFPRRLLKCHSVNIADKKMMNQKIIFQLEQTCYL